MRITRPLCGFAALILCCTGWLRRQPSRRFHPFTSPPLCRRWGRVRACTHLCQSEIEQIAKKAFPSFLLVAAVVIVVVVVTAARWFFAVGLGRGTRRFGQIDGGRFQRD